MDSIGLQRVTRRVKEIVMSMYLYHIESSDVRNTGTTIEKAAVPKYRKLVTRCVYIMASIALSQSYEHLRRPRRPPAARTCRQSPEHLQA